MMRVWIFLFFIAALLLACGSGKVPADIIAPDKMEVIIWQLMQSDEYVNLLVAKDSTKKVSTEKMKIYQAVFDLNKTSLAEFKKSYGFYMAHPDITKGLFDTITAKAGRQRTELYSAKIDSASIKHTPPHRPGTDSPAKIIAPPPVAVIKPASDSAKIKDIRRRLRLYKPKPDSILRHIKKR